MKKILFFFGINLLLIEAFSFTPTPEQIEDLNKALQKYSDYRYALEHVFTVVSANNETGTNIPASNYHKRTDDNGNIYKTFSYSDGNSQLPYYIGLLATEYALLKRNGEDYSHTRDLLSWALDAFERLDRTAEQYYRADGTIKPLDDVNGFFLRDDIYPSFRSPYYVSSQFSKYCNSNSQVPDFPTKMSPAKCTSPFQGNDGNFINSKDMYWNYLINFALVKALVDDYGIKNRVMKFTSTMILHLHNGSDGSSTYWVNKNPITSIFWPGGGDIDGGTFSTKESGNPYLANYCEALGQTAAERTGLRWGLAYAANWITDYSNGNPDEYPNCWQATRNYPFRDVNGNIRQSFYHNITYDDNADGRNGRRFCLTVMGDNNEYRNETDDKNGNIYHYLKGKRDYDTKLDVITGEHLPLIYLLLHNFSEVESYVQSWESNEINYYLSNFLNTVPYCGELMPRSGVWSTDNRLLWAHNVDPANEERTDFQYMCRLDYMLLHNLFRLVYIDKIHTRGSSNSNYFSDIEHNNWPNICFDWIERFGNSITNSKELKRSEVKEISDYAQYEINYLPGFSIESGIVYEGKILNSGCIPFRLLTPDTEHRIPIDN